MAALDLRAQELVTSYACLILHDDNVPITEDNIKRLIDHAGGKVEPYWPKLFADMLRDRDIGESILAGGGVGGAMDSGDSKEGGEDVKQGTKPEEPEKDEDEDEMEGGLGLFGDDDDEDEEEDWWCRKKCYYSTIYLWGVCL